MLNFTVGPVTLDKEVLKIGSKQMPYFRNEEFSAMTLESEELLKQSMNSPVDSKVVFLTASGTAAMEATVLNLFDQEDKLLVVNGGVFGSRFSEICQVHSLHYKEIKLNFFEDLTIGDLIPYDKKGFTGLLINIHETSTGVLYDINLVKEFCKKNHLLLVIDAISSYLADPFDMEGSTANAVIISSQKALGLPPGMSYVVLDKKSQDRVREISFKSVYFNFNKYLSDGERGQTPYTPAVSNLLQLNKKLKYVDKQSVTKIIKETRELAIHFRNEIIKLPFEIPTKSPSNALTAVSPLRSISPESVVQSLKMNSDIYVMPNGGELSCKIFRVGHLGAITIENNQYLLDEIKKNLKTIS
ncbi:aspartate aminotransferase [Sporosarcina sp. P21c]|uniref:pyridoxal-phosphate-dependent aminotransferase family protein n=1 Tax=unclassified Sporosarcina TaxID=2647733 RepID=UPI000C165189|nr:MULTISPECIES: aminotransferase class V-fold PLP-dependent enzyme [unclassified Sporosarcina]PIC66104.1 aspartate aminotransferase [Sporosarcina sp. P16a]PIC88635.1 aspartate aminotransferase [Sporosarcina sp. P21c]PIC91706.1 aspartate aminotransferase [Sporosarcina sp. P25]